MNELQIFSNKEFGQIRTIEIDNEPWFVGKDIATALGYSDTSDAIKRHVDTEDKLTRRFTDSGQSREMYVINESGLYSLILSSKLDDAKKFKKWITSEVIPSIRKNGGYLAGQENMTPEQIVANALIVAQNIIADRDRQIEEMQPKADYFDALVDRKLNTNFRDTAKELGIGEKRFISFLLGKYIYRDQNGKLKPYATYTTNSNKLFEVKEYTSRTSDHAGIQTLITPKGRETFRLLLEKEIQA